MKYKKPQFSLPTFLPPSPYQPFLRRFTDERATDLAETRALFAAVSAQFTSSVWAHPEAIDRFNSLIAELVCKELPVANHELACAIDRCNTAVLSLETSLFSAPRVSSTHLSLKDHVELRRALRAQEYFLANDERVSQLLLEAICLINYGLLAGLPEIPTHGTFTVPLHTTVDLNDVVDRIVGTLATSAHADAGLFTEINDRIYRNICHVSGVVPYSDSHRPLVTAADSGLRGEDLIEAYLAGTPLIDLFLTPVPYSIPRDTFAEHGAIFAPTGHGKTRLLEHLIVDFLKSDDPPALFIMDSMGAMLSKIERLKVISPEKLVILDPTDEVPPALNFFQLKGGSKAQRTGLFFYLFKAIEQGLTQRQATMVAYLVELMQQIPGATLDTLRQVCESRNFHHQYALANLDPIVRDFFAFQFMGKDSLINQTKQQIAQRLYTVGRNPTFNLMFNAPDNRFDAFECMQAGKVVLINTDRLHFGNEASGIFGRFIIAQCLAAALARASVPERDRRLALLIVDEAKQYLDEQAETILADARQFGLGMLLATQAPHQLDDGVQRELATNTSIKMVGPVAYSVASHLARDMHTTPEFIMGMRKRDYQYTEFATYVRGLTPRAMTLQIPMDTLSLEPVISDAEHRALRKQNRKTYGARPPEATSNTPVELAKKSSDIELVINVSRRLESLLETHLGAVGRGPHEKLMSVESELPPNLVHRARYVATMRNKVLHIDSFSLPDRDWFLACARAFEDHFSAAFPSAEREAREDVKPQPAHAEAKKPKPDDHVTPDPEY